MAGKTAKDDGAKTNAMRLLDAAGVAYATDSYAWSEEDLSGNHAAAELGVDPAKVFKTLVARGEKTGIHVFCIPVAKTLDLKKCAALCGEKRFALLPLKELLPVTGYLRGGCSPVGMKKSYPTHIHETALSFPEGIYVSAGLRGRQLFLAPRALADFLGAAFGDLVQ